MRVTKGFSVFLILLISVFLVACSTVTPPSTKTGTGSTTGDTTKGGSSDKGATSTPVSSGNKVTPRNETLYIDGLQWGPPASFNLLSGNPAFPINYGNSRELVYETLFMINMLDGKLEPLLGTKYTWTDPNTLQINLNPAAKWSDGQPFTSDDVVYTYGLGKKYSVSWSSYWDYIDSVTANGPNTVIIKMKPNNPNQLTIEDSIELIPMLPKHIWSAIEKKDNNDLATIQKEFNANPVGTGPYKIYFYNDQKITLIRDDNYWGKALFGKLPAPKYITHVIYKDNASGDLAFKSGQVDISQQFTPQISKMWANGAPVKTYLSNPPYYLPGSMPSVFFNMTKKGLDNANIRKALAMATNYDKISQLAMSGYSGKMVPSITLNTPAESKYIDQSAVQSLQWTTDVKAANALLDKIGAKKGADGIRVLNGQRLGPWYVECPYGWSDWQASLEIFSENAKAIGIDIRTKFPEAPVWTNDLQTGKFDIIMNTPAGGVSPSQPWNRARTIMYSKGVAPIGQMAFWNWGRYKNPQADALIDKIPAVTDPTQLKSLYTQLDKIYLTDIPSIPLEYRPWVFYTVNESVWKGFPVEGDGSNIPPQIGIDGAGIKALYSIHN